jgi:hypothetical protein
MFSSFQACCNRITRSRRSRCFRTQRQHQRPRRWTSLSISSFLSKCKGPPAQRQYPAKTLSVKPVKVVHPLTHIGSASRHTQRDGGVGVQATSAFPPLELETTTGAGGGSKRPQRACSQQDAKSGKGNSAQVSPSLLLICWCS